MLHVHVYKVLINLALQQLPEKNAAKHVFLLAMNQESLYRVVQDFHTFFNNILNKLRAII